MHISPLHPCAPSFVTLLKACTNSKDVHRGICIHTEVARLGFLDTNIFIGSALVDMYAKCGWLKIARQVLGKLCMRNVVSWTALITGYVDNGCFDEALKCFDQMQGDGVIPNSVTFIGILKACASTSNMDRGEDVHSKLERQGLLRRDLSISNTLVDMYAKCGSLARAQQVFDEVVIQDAVSWTILIGGYVESGLGKKALYYFEQMQLEGVIPDAVTVVYGLKACSILGAMDKVQEIHDGIKRQGILERNLYVGSALIDVYSKNRLLEKAQQVFDGLPVRSVVIWNACITGFTEDERYEEALNYFEQMLLERVVPDAVTFICILKACSQLGVVHLGEEIHVEIERRGLLESHLVLGNMLVDMYLKTHLIPVAQQIFDKLPSRDVVTWNVLIAGYMENEHDMEVIDFLKQMQLEGVCPDGLTLVYSLKACAAVQTVDEVHEIHIMMEKRGMLETYPAASSTLLDSYAKLGRLCEAQKLFDIRPTRNTESWNALITGYTDYGYGEKALECFEQMQLDHVPFDAVTYVGSLRACASLRAFDTGKRIHSDMQKHGLFETNLVINNTLVDMYAKCGLFAIAAQVLDRLPARDAVSWTAFITGLVEHGHGDEALDRMAEMEIEGVYPSAATLVCGLRACASAEDMGKGRGYHAEIERHGLLERDVIVGNTLVEMYAECGLFSTALEVFERLPGRDVVSWTALISRYAEHGHSEEALECFQQMQEEGIPPDVVTFVCGLKACVGIGATNKLTELYAKIDRQGFLEKNHFVDCSLVDMFAKCGLLKQARQVFDRLPVKNAIAWNVLIAGYAQHGYGEEALECLEEMQLKGFFPDMATFICCLQACGSTGAIAQGIELHYEIERRGFLGGDLVGNALVDMYAKCGSLARAEQVLGVLPARDVVTWTALMRGYAHLGESENAFAAFNGMLHDGLRPDPITFIVILSTCSRMGLSNKSWTYFESMSKDYGIAPIPDHHSCMVDVLSRSGQLDKAAAAIKDLPFSPTSVVWHTILGACQSLGSLDLAKEAFGHAMDRDDKDSVAYSFMCRICTSVHSLEHSKVVNAV